MITIENYFDTIKSLDTGVLPAPLKKGYDYVNTATAGGQTWEAYEQSKVIREKIDEYFTKLNAFLQSMTPAPETKQAPKQAVKANPTVKNAAASRRTPIPKQKPLPGKEEVPVNLVERIPEEIKFMRRYLNLHGKEKTERQMLNFITALQKAILEKRIRKTSPWAIQIRHMQDKLIEVFNAMKGKGKLELSAITIKEFKSLVSQEKVYPAVQFIKRYINLNGKPGTRDKAKALAEQMKKAALKGKVTDKDPRALVLKKIYENLMKFVENKKAEAITIEPGELSGLEGILSCACEKKSVKETPSLMPSTDFVNLQFDTIGFTGKWLDLIGDPSPGFTVMVFGKPKMGKSYLCLDFAGYLAHNHGKVLYVAKEEQLDATLQIKVRDKNVAHPNLIVSDHLPKDISEYDFIFLDSVNRLGLSVKDLNNLEAKNPGKSFIYVFQTTKGGNFRGAQQFQHNVDAIIEVPEKGKALQYGRFNQGGEINIFYS